MTNHFIDYQHCDVFLVCGGNPAENHPMAMRWIGKAKARGAKLIVVDPRFTKTATQADVYSPIRPGTDIPFLMGIVNYAIQNNLFQREYVLNYTNASCLINPNFKLPAENNGVFSGFVHVDGNEPAKTDTSTWTYQMEGDAIKKDPTLQDPNCVFQLLKRHASRYDARTVARITGMTEEKFLEIAKLYCSTGQPGKAGNYIYALGITQHSYGVQNVRAIGLMQLLLGNIGIAGGGVSAQRGESNVQGATDMAMLYHYIPGYNPVPNAAVHKDWAMYRAKETPGGYWSNRPKFVVSMLKAWWKDASKDNDWRFDYLPKTTGREHSHMRMFYDMSEGIIKGFICMGQNPMVGGVSTLAAGKAMEKLDWMVVMDPFAHETARFWERPGANPAEIETEVFFLPACHLYEKEGSITNGNRWIQWRYKAIEPLGDSKNDLWIVNELFKAVRKEYEKGGVFTNPILTLDWDYDAGGHEPDWDKVALEMNGYDVATGKGLESFGQLKEDGSTACGIWIYTGYFSNRENPNVKRRIREPEGQGIGCNLEWAFVWPANRRILYNRASCDPAGRPWNPNIPVVAWDGSKWITNDVPDFGAVDAETGAPNPPEKTAKAPFIMNAEGLGRLFAIAPGLKDGPFPEHYEPVESPVNNIMGPLRSNPYHARYKGVFSPLAKPEDPEYPIILSTHRVQEHYQSGASTRCMPNLVELKPEPYVEMSRELAAKLGVKGADWVYVTTARGEIKIKAYVTPCLKPFNIDGKEVEVVMIPYSWGFAGLGTGATVNDLTPAIGDPTSLIPEYKAFLCNIRKA